MVYQSIKQRLDQRQPLLLDGATGTELERRGAQMSDAAWCALVSANEPDLLEQIHIDYIDAGADIITANTFATTRLMLSSIDQADRVAELINTSIEVAKRARDKASNGREIAVAGSLSHMIPLAAATDIADESKAGGPEVIKAAFEEAAHCLAEAGCDLILLEMMYYPERMRLAIEAALTTGLPVWCGMSVRAGSNGEVLSFSRFAEIGLAQMLDEVPFDRIDALGIMHSGAEITGPAIEALSKSYDGPLMAYPDSGYFAMPNWQFVDIMPPEIFVGRCRDWYQSGAIVLGGCCGLGLDHIRALSQNMQSWRN